MAAILGRLAQQRARYTARMQQTDLSPQPAPWCAPARTGVEVRE